MTADAPPPNPASCEDLYDEARTRPRSIRLLPSITRDAVRLVWAAASRELTVIVVLKLANGAGLAMACLLGKDLTARLLTDEPPPRTVDILPKVVLVDGLIGTVGRWPVSPGSSSRCWPSSPGSYRWCSPPPSRPHRNWPAATTADCPNSARSPPPILFSERGHRSHGRMRLACRTHPRVRSPFERIELDVCASCLERHSAGRE